MILQVISLIIRPTCHYAAAPRLLSLVLFGVLGRDPFHSVDLYLDVVAVR